MKPWAIAGLSETGDYRKKVAVAVLVLVLSLAVGTGYEHFELLSYLEP